MKPKFYTKLITLVAGFMMLANVNVAMAQDYYDFKSGQLYYKIIDATAKTVKVVSELDYHNNDAISYNEGNRPSGDITIPATVVNPKDNKIYSVKEISSFVFDNCELRDVVISEGIEVIRVVAFDNSLIMNALYIPASVTKIEEGFMFSCVFYPVENPLRIAKGNKNYTIIDHILYSIDKKTLLLCPSYTFIKYTIPNTVTKIAHYAFCATVLEEIVIPASVTNIGELVFHGCKELRSIHCKVDDPSKISMGEHVFNFVPINTCTLYVPTGSKAKYQAAPQWKDFTNIVEKDIEKYPLWVAGTQVDENNASDIKGEGITGKVSYDPDTKTLTLNGATIDGGANNGIFNEGIDNLKIELIGNNTVSNTAESGNSAINLLKNTTIAGTGTLTVQAKYVAILFNACNLNIEDGCTVIATSEKWGISGAGTTEVLTVKNSTLKATGASQYSIGAIDKLILEGCEIIQPDDATFIHKPSGGGTTGFLFVGENIVDSEVIIAPIYELFIKGVQVNIQNENDILGDGTVKYAPTDKILTLTNVNIDDMGIGIYNKGIEGLTINVIGDNNNIATQGGALYLMKSTTITGSGTLKTSGDFSNISLSNCNLTIKDGCTVTAYSQSDRAISGVSGTEQLIINNSTVKATGSMTGSIGNLAELILEDCEIVSPAGAKWDATQKAVVDSEGNVVTEEVVISNTTGIDEVEAARLLNFYPNPAREHITIKIADDLKTETLYIIDISGRIIRTEPISDSTMTLDVSKYAKGIYLIKAGKVNRRLIIK